MRTYHGTPDGNVIKADDSKNPVRRSLMIDGETAGFRGGFPESLPCLNHQKAAVDYLEREPAQPMISFSGGMYSNMNMMCSLYTPSKYPISEMPGFNSIDRYVLDITIPSEGLKAMMIFFIEAYPALNIRIFPTPLGWGFDPTEFEISATTYDGRRVSLGAGGVIDLIDLVLTNMRDLVLRLAAGPLAKNPA